MLVTKKDHCCKSDKIDILEGDGGASEKVIPLNGLVDIPPFTRVTCEAKVVVQRDRIMKQKSQN